MSSLRRYPLPLVFSLSALLFPSLFFLPAPYYHLSFSLCTALKLFGSIISTLQRIFSRSLSTYQFRLHCFASSWLPGGTREHELLIKFHSFLASLFFFRFSQPHLNCAGIEMAVALISHSAPILRSRIPFLSCLL